MLTCGGFYLWRSQKLLCASDTQTQKQDGYGHRQRVRKGGGEGGREGGGKPPARGLWQQKPALCSAPGLHW